MTVCATCQRPLRPDPRSRTWVTPDDRSWCRAPGARFYGPHDPDVATGLLAALRVLAAP